MKRNASAIWKGGLKDGKGEISTASGVLSATQYSFSTRFEDGIGTNPEELIAAAHAGCFSMALSGNIAKAGFEPQHVTTSAKVHFDKGDAGFSITKIDLISQAQVGGGIDDAAFQEIARQTKETCPVSRALAAVPEIVVQATLA